MAKSKKPTLFLGIILFIFLALGATYYIGFYPKSEVTNINSISNFNQKMLLNKLTSNNLNISSKEVSLETSIALSEDDLTDLFVNLIASNSKLSNIITGIKAEINDNKINVLLHLKYKGIPLEGNLVFSCEALNGKCVLHYESGNLGFISINKDLIFSKLISNEILDIDKEAGDIILKVKNLKGLEIKNLSIKNNEVIFTIKGTLNLQDLNKLK
ncbi:hypothetical protein [Clostridium uliginosum]|uniref:DUF2993 domain-containing protein n=1 Tax=Clostridium uliginosum TaxID=119641 RepID=A0A1I1S3C4_9CLOT|nr:hypothetical protein [Clostridium uliginosum]SFD41035.1 hypothetical protein SAMN05421842_14311 [Clostridium uliginosum]